MGAIGTAGRRSEYEYGIRYEVDFHSLAEGGSECAKVDLVRYSPPPPLTSGCNQVVEIARAGYLRWGAFSQTNPFWLICA